MLASASGVLNTRVLPNSFCRPCVTLKTPPLPLTLPRYSSRETSATSSPNTTMRSSRRISSRHAGVEQVHHRGRVAARTAGRPRCRTARPSGRRRASTPRRCTVLGVGLRLLERVVGGGEHLGVHLVANRLELGLGGVAFADEPLGEARERVARRVGLALLLGAVEHLVVGERVRVRPDHLGVHERRALALARVVRRRAASPRTRRGGRSRPPPGCRGRGSRRRAWRSSRRRCSPRPGTEIA